MALKTRLGCCLLLSLFVFVETAASSRICDAIIDVTFLIDSSSKLQNIYNQQIGFFTNFVYSSFRPPNDVLLNVRFYPPFVLQYLPLYGSYINRGQVIKTMHKSVNYQRVNEDDDVITALMAASRPMPETDCRRKRGGRRVVVVVADEVDKRVLGFVPPSEFRNLMEERKVEIVALAIGNSSTLDVLDDILDPNYGDTLIRLASVDMLESARDDVANELCEVTPEMTSYKEMMSSSFRANFTYNGHAYYLSRAEFDNLTQVHDTCSSAGGYLAVINDQQEYDAMKQYFIDNDPGYGFYIDGTDAHIEGMWTLLSGEPLPFVDWLNAPRPDRPELDCLVWAIKSHQMFDGWCDGQNHPNYRHLFLCEVPDCDAK